MSFNAFPMIQDALAEELEKQGFGAPEALEFENGRAVMYATDAVAYALRYDVKRQRFELCSSMIDDKGQPGEWRSLSMWLYDEHSGERADAESILEDFLEVVRGPKRVAVVQQKRKGGKNSDERNVDPMFFINRLANLFPELKNDLNEEKIVYGQVRYVTFVKEKAAPLCQDLVLRYPDSDPCKRLCSLLDDMYKNGDLDVRSIVAFTLVNCMSDEAFSALYDRVGDELQKDIKYTRKLKDKKIKPEKPKKQRGKRPDVRLGG